jgi:hypothetical protein
MFAIATADMGYMTYILFGHLLKGALTFQHMRPKYWLYVTNNVLADSTLLYRCYVVWGGDLKIMALPSLLFVTSMICGYLFEGSPSYLFAYSWVYVMLTFSLNVILTCLIAGRIWWLSWKGKRILDRQHRRRYYVAMAAILESGLITSLYMLPDLILANIVLDNGFIQVVGIMPTLIVVQIGLGRSVTLVEEASEETLAPIEIAELTSTRDQVISNKSHVISFYPDKDVERVRSKRESESGSMLGRHDQLRIGEDKVPIAGKNESYREKSPKLAVKQEESESEPGQNSGKGSEKDDQRSLPKQSFELDTLLREEAPEL